MVGGVSAGFDTSLTKSASDVLIVAFATLTWSFNLLVRLSAITSISFYSLLILRLRESSSLYSYDLVGISFLQVSVMSESS